MWLLTQGLSQGWNQERDQLWSSHVWGSTDALSWPSSPWLLIGDSNSLPCGSPEGATQSTGTWSLQNKSSKRDRKRENRWKWRCLSCMLNRTYYLTCYNFIFWRRSKNQYEKQDVKITKGHFRDCSFLATFWSPNSWWTHMQNIFTLSSEWLQFWDRCILDYVLMSFSTYRDRQIVTGTYTFFPLLFLLGARFFFFFEARSCYVSQAGPKLLGLNTIFLSQIPK